MMVSLPLLFAQGNVFFDLMPKNAGLKERKPGFTASADAHSLKAACARFSRSGNAFDSTIVKETQPAQNADASAAQVSPETNLVEVKQVEAKQLFRFRVVIGSAGEGRSGAPRSGGIHCVTPKRAFRAILEIKPWGTSMA